VSPKIPNFQPTKKDQEGGSSVLSKAILDELSDLKEKHSRLDKLFNEKSKLLDQTKKNLDAELNNKNEFDDVKNLLNKEIKDYKEKIREKNSKIESNQSELDSQKNSLNKEIEDYKQKIQEKNSKIDSNQSELDSQRKSISQLENTITQQNLKISQQESAKSSSNLPPHRLSPPLPVPVGSPPWSIKSLMTRWKIMPL